jgi:hypothetical protein
MRPFLYKAPYGLAVPIKSGATHFNEKHSHQTGVVRPAEAVIATQAITPIAATIDMRINSADGESSRHRGRKTATRRSFCFSLVSAG